MSAPLTEGVAEQIQQIRANGLPRHESMALIQNSESVQQTVMAHAIAESDAEAGDEVDQYWLPSQEVIVIDLASATANAGDE